MVHQSPGFNFNLRTFLRSSCVVIFQLAINNEQSTKKLIQQLLIAFKYGFSENMTPDLSELIILWITAASLAPFFVSFFVSIICRSCCIQ